jgi:hypothetical protein
VPLPNSIDRCLNAYRVLLPAGTVVVLLCVFIIEATMDIVVKDFLPLLIALLLLGSAGYATALWCSQAIRTDLKLLSLTDRPASGHAAS